MAELTQRLVSCKLTERRQRKPKRSKPGQTGGKGLRAFYCFAVAILLLFVLDACSAASERQKLIYDDEAELAKQGDTYSYAKRVGETSNGSSAFSFSSFYGMETIWIIYASGKGMVTFDHRQEIDRGKFKLVAIGPDNEVTTLAEGSSEGKMELKVSQGTYCVKVVGKGAKGRLDSTIAADAGIRIVDAVK